MSNRSRLKETLTVRQHLSKIGKVGLAAAALLVAAACQATLLNEDKVLLSVSGKVSTSSSGDQTEFESKHVTPDANAQAELIKIGETYAYSVELDVRPSHNALGLKSPETAGSGFNPNQRLDLEQSVAMVTFELYELQTGGAPKKFAEPFLVTRFDEPATLSVSKEEDLVFELSVLASRVG